MEQAVGLFTSDEEELLKKTRKVRLDLIDSMTEDTVPTRSGDIRVLNETLDAMDRQILDIAKIKAKATEEDNNNKVTNMVVELLSRVSSNTPLARNSDISLPDEYIPVDVVPGELDINADRLELKDFINGGNEDE